MESNQSWQTIEKDKKIDVYINNKGIVLSDKLEKIRLRLENKLRLFANEWFIHENEGLNWLKRNSSNGQIGNLLQQFNIESQIRKTIVNDEAVEEILEFESDFSNISGEYNFNMKILLKSGEILTF